MAAAARIFHSERLFEWAQRSAFFGQAPLVRRGSIGWLPGPLSGWSAMRDLPALPRQSFRAWWRERQ